MTIILSHDLTVQEIRVLQEYRRVTGQSLTTAAINAIRHPVGGGESPAVSLAQKGYLEAAGDIYALTQKARDFLALDVKPEVEGSSSGEAEQKE